MLTSFFKRISVIGFIFFAVTGIIHPTLAAARPFGAFEQPLPGFPATIDAFVNGEQRPLIKYMTWMINFITAAITAGALLIIVIGGYTYMTAGGDGKKVETAKTYIRAALLSIILALVAFLVLNFISPQFASQLREPLSLL